MPLKIIILHWIGAPLVSRKNIFFWSVIKRIVRKSQELPQTRWFFGDYNKLRGKRIIFFFVLTKSQTLKRRKSFLYPLRQCNLFCLKVNKKLHSVHKNSNTKYKIKRIYSIRKKYKLEKNNKYYNFVIEYCISMNKDKTLWIARHSIIHVS